MKTLILLSALALSVNTLAGDKYTEQMSRNIEAVYKAQTAEELQAAINLFDRIGNAEKTKWEPFYYQSFG